MSLSESNRLCVECGLCCNGVIFARGELRPGDDPERLKQLGLRIPGSRVRGAQKFRQPCAALEGCRCRIYSERPQYCRQFECLLLKSLREGEVGFAEARRVVRRALQQVKRADELLAGLGETDRSAPLELRFRRVQRQLEQGTSDPESTALFGELTLVVHDLHLLLQERFYPG